jgi:hypothetical protein
LRNNYGSSGSLTAVPDQPNYLLKTKKGELIDNSILRENIDILLKQSK